MQKPTVINSSEAPGAMYLDKFIKRSKKRLKNILKRLHWDEETVLKDFNSNKGKNSHSDIEKEPTFPLSFTTGNSINISQEELRSIVSDCNVVVPQRFSDLQINFSREQKLRIYEQVVQNTDKLLEPEMTVPGDDHKTGNLTFAQIVAIKKREKKLKRRKYRTSKPTYIEEVRHLVELQMQAMEQYLKPNEVGKSSTKNDSREQRGRQRNNRSPFKERCHEVTSLRNSGRSNRHSKRCKRDDAKGKRSVSRESHRYCSESKEKYSKKRSRSRHRHDNSRERKNRSKSRNSTRRKHQHKYRSQGSSSNSYSGDEHRRLDDNYKSSRYATATKDKNSMRKEKDRGDRRRRSEHSSQEIYDSKRKHYSEQTSHRSYKSDKTSINIDTH